jgi:carbamoyl-phosphate synthase large subunit
VTYYTTLAGARAACIGMASMQELQAYSLQALHGLEGSMPPSLHPDGEEDMPFKAQGTDLQQI